MMKKDNIITSRYNKPIKVGINLKGHCPNNLASLKAIIKGKVIVKADLAPLRLK